MYITLQLTKELWSKLHKWWKNVGRLPKIIFKPVLPIRNFFLPDPDQKDQIRLKTDLNEYSYKVLCNFWQNLQNYIKIIYQDLCCPFLLNLFFLSFKLFEKLFFGLFWPKKQLLNVIFKLFWNWGPKTISHNLPSAHF